MRCPEGRYISSVGLIWLPYYTLEYNGSALCCIFVYFAVDKNTTATSYKELHMALIKQVSSNNNDKLIVTKIKCPSKVS